MKTVRKSSFSDLAKYLSDAQDLKERVGDVRLTNCYAHELDDAVFEVLATQAQNTRATGDKTYHLIISFRTGENPGEVTLTEIERRICKGLGFDEHQRISVTHQDTDNLHIHIAINKIHPTRLVMHEPFLAYRQLAKLCVSLEAEFGLAVDNHETKRCGSQSRASDMEHAAGMESLLGWITRECLPSIQTAQSWRDLHRQMRDSGLMLRELGNGLVIQSDNGTTVKASSVSRELSKPRLQARFGPFEPGQERPNQTGPLRKYQANPRTSGASTNDLYLAYKADQLRVSSMRSTTLQNARTRKDQAAADAKASALSKRIGIKLLGGGHLIKRALYAFVSKSLLTRIREVNMEYLTERKTLSAHHSHRTWNAWLQLQAKSGNTEALAALRARASKAETVGNVFTGTPQASTSPLPLPEHVTKKGALVYSYPGVTIRDDGKKLAVCEKVTPAGLKIALQMAVQQYGQSIAVSGSGEFIENLVQVAAKFRINVRFSEAGIERRHRVLLARGNPVSQVVRRVTKSKGI